ncbi:10969_t:CDS:2 [Gigaspora rosea]|nr:10969_t:CDS:2 [Gigaspora rosea]
MQRDIITHFTRFASLRYKVLHESYIVQNSISWRNINFEKSYVIQYSKRKQKEEFNMLKHSRTINFLDFFVCRCGTDKTNFRDSKFQTVDKSLPPNEKIGRLSKRGSLMRLKKHFRTLKLDYDIFFYVKNFNDTTSTIYKDEKKLLREFKKYIFRKGKKRKIVVAETVSLINKRMKHIEDRMNSPEYHPLSPSA